MKIGIILETNDPEKAWNAIRFANTALTKQHEVRLFLMGAGVGYSPQKRNGLKGRIF